MFFFSGKFDKSTLSRRNERLCQMFESKGFLLDFEISKMHSCSFLIWNNAIPLKFSVWSWKFETWQLSWHICWCSSIWIKRASWKLSEYITKIAMFVEIHFHPSDSKTRIQIILNWITLMHLHQTYVNN